MMHRAEQSDVFFGEWLRVADALKPTDDDARRKIAAALGLPWTESAGRVVGKAHEESRTPTTVESLTKQTRSAIDEISVRLRPKRRQAEPAEAQTWLIEPAHIEPVYADRLVSQWNLGQIEPLAKSDLAGQERADPPPELLPRRRLLGVATAALSTHRKSRHVDVRATIRLLAGGRIMRNVPRRSVDDLAAGVQVLMDRGERMQPFCADEDMLLTALVRQLGPARCHAVMFRDDPALGVRASRHRRAGRQPYTLPPPGTPILVVSDAGLGPGPGQWRARPDWLPMLARVAAEQHSRLVLLTPVPDRLRPSSWRRLVWLTWDRSLTIREVLKQLPRRRRDT